MRARSGNTCPAEMYSPHDQCLTKYGEPKLYGNGETDLIMKTFM